MKKFKKLLMFTTVIAMFVLCCVFSASAMKEGYYTFTVKNDEAIITYVDESIRGNITIPKTLGTYPVTTIGQAAFTDCQDLTGAVINNNIKIIEEEAFHDCDALESITFGKKVHTIGDWAFSECESLISVTVPGNVKNLGEGVFGKCQNLAYVTIEKGVPYIGDEMFFDTAIKSITLPDSVTKIGEYAFECCDELIDITIPNSVTRIEEGAFEDCESVEAITIPYSVTYIGPDALYNCNELTDITIYSTNCVFEEGSGINYYHTIIGFKGSTAEALAKNRGAGFVDVERVHSHSYKTTYKKATLSKNGKNETRCPVCGKTKSSIVYYRPTTIKLSATSYLYDGKVKTPAVTVKNSKGKALKKDTDYTITYENGRKAIGKYTVTITFKGNYSGTKKLTFSILPGVTSKLTATQTTSSVTIKWNKVAGAEGYRVYTYRKKKWKKLADTTKLTYTNKKLNSGSTFKYRVKAYGKDGEELIWAADYKEITTSTKPLASTLKATSTAKGKATLTWSNPSGESGFEIYYSTKKDSGFKKIATTKANVKKATVSKLQSKKTYYFKVRSFKTTQSGKAYSAYSAVKSVKVK